MDIKEAYFQNKITIIYCTDIFTEQSTLKTEMYLILLCTRENKMNIYLNK